MYTVEKYKQCIRRNYFAIAKLALLLVCSIASLYRGDAMLMAVTAFIFAGTLNDLNSEKISDLEEVVEQLKKRIDC